MQDENMLTPETDNMSARQPKKDLVKSAKDFLENTFGGKNTDLNTTIEQFTAEMTLVAEGLSEDQTRLSQQADRLNAQQTAFEAETLDKFHDLSVAVQENQEQMNRLEEKLDKLQKLTAEKKTKKVDGWTGLLRQATYLIGILAGAWIITTLINFFK